MKRIRSIIYLGLALLAVPCLGGPFDDPFYLYGNSSSAPGIYSYRARGHSRDPEVLQSNDVMGGILAGGYMGATGFTSSSRVSIQMLASEAWSSTANGTKIVFKTTPDTTTSPATALTIAGSLITVGTSGFLLPISTGPRTNVTPTAAGQIIFNSTDKELCFSTGTVQTSWALSSSAVTACSH